MSSNRYNNDLCNFFVVNTDEHIVVLDATSKPFIIFPRCGRDWSFFREYVAGMLNYSEVHFSMRADIKGKFKKDYQALIGTNQRKKNIRAAWKAVEKLEE